MKTKTKKYYALHWICGYGTVYANDGREVVEVMRFDTSAERDESINDFRAPNHCPTARLEPVPASDRNVRAAIINDEFKHVD